jgi:hypothetical protein
LPTDINLKKVQLDEVHPKVTPSMILKKGHQRKIVGIIITLRVHFQRVFK